eukprot:EG_transcript_22816
MSSEISSVLWEETPSNQAKVSNDGFFSGDYSERNDGGIAYPSQTYTPQFNPTYLGTSFDDEKPLLEELGIDFGIIQKKVKLVINPFKKGGIDTQMAQDADLAGPLFFCSFLGCLLLLTGKVHFGYIFGMGMAGCVFVYLLLNVMCEKVVELQYTVSTLGYCLCPTIMLGFWRILAALGLHFVPWWISYPSGLALIGWSSICATNMFVDGLGMADQRYLILYPITLLYSMFALISIF